MKQAREAGIEIPFVGNDGYGEFWRTIVDKSLLGSYWVAHVSPDALAAKKNLKPGTFHSDAAKHRPRP